MRLIKNLIPDFCSPVTGYRSLVTGYLPLALAAFLLACAVGFAQAGSDHAFGQAAGNCGGMWKLPDTGQAICYNDTGGVITCPAPEAALAQDGSYQPAVVQPSYKILNPVGVSSVTVDNRTGLMWVTNPNDAGIGGTYTWDSSTGAVGVCETLNYAGYGPGAANNGWRLPNIKELQSIVDYRRQNPSINGTYFLNTQANYYWSSTTYVPDTSAAWDVVFNDGVMSAYSKTVTFYVRCVRGGP